MKRVLRILGIVLLLFLVVLVGALAWLLGTESGTRQALALGQRFAPGTLEWDAADGRLTGPLQIDGFRYAQEDGLSARVDSLALDWTPSALVGRRLELAQLHIDGVELRLPEPAPAPAEEAPAGEGLPEIDLPVSIDLQDVALSNIAVYPAGQDTPIEIDRVALAGTVDGSDVQLSSLEVDAPEGSLRIAGDVKTSGDYPMNLALDWQTDIADVGPFSGEGTVTGDLASLQIEHQVQGLVEAEILATVSDVMSEPGWDASVMACVPDVAALPVDEGVADRVTEAPRLRLQSRGTLDAFEAQATLASATTDTGPVTIDADVAGSTEQLDIRSLAARFPRNGGESDGEGGRELSAQGRVDLETLAGEIEGEWHDLGWPLVGESAYQSAAGRFVAEGSAEHFTATVNADVDGEAIPPGAWQVSLEGSSTVLDAFTLEGETLAGTITGSGTAAWADAPTWDLRLTTAGVNPGEQWPELPGAIDLDVTSSGELLESGPELTADILRLAGDFRGQPLAGNGRIRVAGETLVIDELDLSHGPSRLTASGKVDEKIALNFDLASPDLGTLLPELGGDIALEGTLSGTREAPQVKANGRAENVVQAENRVAALDFAIDGGLGPDVRSTLSLNASGISAGGQTIHEVALAGEGSEADHRVTLTAASDMGDIATTLEGGYASETWQGTLSTLQLDNTEVGDWALRAPVAIAASAAQADVADLCLDNRDRLGSLCITGNWLAAGESTGKVSISEFSPALAAQYLPEGFIIETKLDGEADASLGANGDMRVDGQFVLQPGKLEVDSAGTPVEIGLEETTIDVAWLGDNATLALASAFTDFGNLDLQATVADPAGVGGLDGRLDLDFTDLSLISAFAPQMQEVVGTLVGDLALGGTVSAPAIEGEVALRGFGAEIPATAMVIEDTDLVVKGRPGGVLEIDGQSRSGGGELAVNGTVKPATRAIEITIEGENYEVANSGLIKAVITPELAVNMDDTDMSVKGSVTIPRAYINANGGNEGIKTVGTSSDVVFVTDDPEPAATESASAASQVAVNVQVNLGDSVEVEAGDFRGRLEGGLRVKQTPGTPPRGTGTINVVNGDFMVYGQKLNMERGKVLFSGGPVDNPKLDMQVARKVTEYDVTAGARIQGTAQSPRLELYSDPPMPDASILSFILRGQPLDSSGLSVTLGKYLTPDLYVSYGIGLFDAINTFNLRYSISEKLAFEAENGSGSSADLIYTIER
ncbi:MAG: hypothetical protein CSB44_09355 [Gammaproteobacteria bacterium]|nr:MAG: hypothetical protein CSB44_09355 [Gammaproteobacteria bacterium]PIE36998.1 MAG: hypothetical protein CSA54_02425 [Gammaproteobacteria bacterium]